MPDSVTPRWSFLRGLSYFFGNRDIVEELSRLRADNFELRERLLEKRNVRPLSESPDRVEVKESPPPDDVDTWRQRREAEIVEEQALPAAKDPVLFEQYEFYAEVDPEKWNPVLAKAKQIRAGLANGMYKEPQER